MTRLLDPSFVYRNAASTNVLDTFRRHGFIKTTQAERNARIRRQLSAAPQVSSAHPPLVRSGSRSSSAVAAPTVNAAPQGPAGNIGMPAQSHRSEAPAVAAPKQINAAQQMSKAVRQELEIPFPEHSSAVAAPNVRAIGRRAAK